MKHIFVALFLFLGFGLLAQTSDGLVAYYPFDDCTAEDASGNDSNGVIIGNPGCDCGVVGNAINLDGSDDRILFLGTISNFFKTKDFTVSLFVKPTTTLGTLNVLSKRTDCTDDAAFAISMTPAANNITCKFSENSSKNTSVSSNIDFGPCWQHITVIRKGSKTEFYLNGILRDESTAVSRVDLDNNGVLNIADGACVGTTDNRFKGLIDEFRIYDRALDREEVEELFAVLAPDRIETPDTLIYLGNSVDIRTSNTCANEFSWTPADDVSNTIIAEPTITPTETRTYNLNFVGDFCIAFDSIRITVIDPDDLDCNEIFLPKAFTPNEDGRNDSYGISNPFAVQNLITLEIFDRWGSRVFFTDDPFMTWDGTFQGKEMNPGILLYKVRYMCNNEEKVNVGSLTIIR